jgi:hypothetical protein
MSDPHVLTIQVVPSADNATYRTKDHFWRLVDLAFGEFCINPINSRNILDERRKNLVSESDRVFLNARNNVEAHTKISIREV